MCDEHAYCDMRGDTNIKSSDSSDPSVYFLFCVSDEKGRNSLA